MQNWEQTLLSQYANSPVILALIDAINSAIDPVSIIGIVPQSDVITLLNHGGAYSISPDINTAQLTGFDTSGAKILVVGVGFAAGSTLTISDDLNGDQNTWVYLTSFEDPVNGCAVQIFYCKPIFTGINHTIKVTGVNAYPAMTVAAYTALGSIDYDSSSIIGATVASATSISPGTFNPPGSGRAVFSVGSSYDPSNPVISVSGATLLDNMTGPGINTSPTADTSEIQTTATAVTPVYNFGSATAAAAAICSFFTAGSNTFYDDVWNIATASGYGLDVWGRIVGVNRIVYLPAGISGNFFSFKEAGNVDGEFGKNQFYYGPVNQNYALSDDNFRILILAKALSNISDGSIGSYNALLMTLFPSRGNVYVIDNGDMTMTINFDFVITAVEKTIVEQTGVFTPPTGVSYTIVSP